MSGVGLRDAGLMLEELEVLVAVESPSADEAATQRALAQVDDLFERHLGARGAWVTGTGERRHLLWQGGGEVEVLLLGHADTVWPHGTVARWPFDVHAGQASGPGAFDMKAGLVQGVHALAQLDSRRGVGFLVTSDEELGSPTSRELIERTARGARAALVLEPSADGALKSTRKGVSLYTLEVAGRAAHAGLEPERGANAAVELAHQVLAVLEVADAAAGTTVTPTVLSAGSTSNTVPATAQVMIDVRAAEPTEQARVDAALRSLVARTPGTRLHVHGGPNRPPLAAAASAPLVARARRIAGELGLPPLADVAVGGGSDGNFTAGMGVPTLDGLGAVGGGAHAEGEYVVVAAMAQRSALVAALVHELLS